MAREWMIPDPPCLAIVFFESPSRTETRRVGRAESLEPLELSRQSYLALVKIQKTLNLHPVHQPWLVSAVTIETEKEKCGRVWAIPRLSIDTWL